MESKYSKDCVTIDDGFYIPKTKYNTRKEAMVDVEALNDFPGLTSIAKAFKCKTCGKFHIYRIKI